jgi:hypothetical protein
MNKFVKSISVSFICVFAFFALFSCEIGLGNSVDTAAPEIAITYPPENSRIRKSFLLSGTWSDDKAVKTVSVEVYKSGENTPIYTTRADVSKRKWSVLLNDDGEAYANQNGWQFIDGEYSIKVIASDGAGHSSYDKRTFTIDNSAPVLQIDKPTTSGSSATPETYGQIVQLEGTFDEDAPKISKMDVCFYSTAGVKLYETSFSNITSMGPSSPLTIARYFSETSGGREEYSELYNAYKAILGEENISKYESGQSVEDVQLYFSITAYDGAKVYTDPSNSSGEGDGNATELYYRGTTSMQNLTKGDGGIENFSLASFASYVNRTSTEWDNYSSVIDPVAASSQSFSVNADLVLDISNDDPTSGESVFLTFDINPKNNPLYSFGGYDIVSSSEAVAEPDSYSSGGYKKVYSGAPVSLTLNVGPDNKAIKTPSVSVYRVDKTGYTGAVTDALFTGSSGKAHYENGDFILLWTWNEDVYNEFSDWGYDVSSVYTPTDSEANITTLSKQLTIDSFESGHDYEFYVIGQDISGNPLVSSQFNGFGFCGTTSITAPVISIKNGNKANSVVCNANFTGAGAAVQSDVLYISGEISSPEVLQSLTYKITVTDSDDDSNSADGTYTIPIGNSAPSASDLKSAYCYTTDTSISPIKYYWRITSAEHASAFSSVIGEGAYDVTVSITANNGVEATSQRAFTLDTKNPEPELSELSVAAEDSTASFWWINPAKSLTVTGLVTDNLSTAKACTSWIKLVAITDAAGTETTSSGAGNVYTSATQSGVNKWSFTVPASQITSSYYGANLYICSKDAAGNEGSSVIKLVFDTTAPSGKHALDGKNKDLFFRVGSYNNDDISKTANPSLWDDDLDTDVGGKYKENTYGNSTTIKIRGNFKEEDSGLNMIYYKVITSPSALEYNTLKTQALNFFANYNKATDYTGYFAPLASGSEETKRIFYTSVSGRTDGKIPLKYLDSNGDIQTSSTEFIVSSTSYITDSKGIKKYYTNIDSNFNSVISGFSSEGINYLILVAEDKVGNAALDCVIAKDSENNDTVYYNASINVDTESPILVCSSHNGQQYTNGVNAITVEGTYNDLPASKNAGVSKITIEVNGISSDADLDNGSWSAQILSSTLSALSESTTYNVNGTITDNAGNSSSSTLFTLSYDKTGPSADVKSPSEGSKVNKLMDLTGSVTYTGSSPKSLVLYASTSVPSGDFTAFDIVDTIDEANKIYSWSITDIDTYALTGVEDAPKTAELYFIPVVTDGAGNNNVYDLATSSFVYAENVNYFKYTVDMDSDRPTVKVTNLTLSDGAYILKYGENAQIEGSVTDDDSTSTAVLKTFVATTSQITGTGSVTTTTDASTGVKTSRVKVGTNTYDITTFNPATGEWTFTPADTADGEKTVNFYIVDNADTVFYTGKTETVSEVDYDYHQPYFQYKTSTAIDSASALVYKSDATAPTVSAQVKAYKSDASTANGAAVSPGTNVTLGGTEKQYAEFIITGTDANGIAGIRLTLTYTSKTDSSEKTYCISSIDGYTGFTKSGSKADTAASSVWTTSKINLSDYATGTVTGIIEVYDKSGLLGTSSQIFAVDNSGPSVTVTSPSSTDELTGEITFAGTSSDSGNAGVVSTKWLIPSTTQAAMTDSVLYAAVDGSGNSVWNDELDSEKTETVWGFTLDAETLAGYDSASYAGTNISNGLYTLPFYVLAEDALGNYTILKTKTFTHNPDADRPLTAITYPNSSNYGTDSEGNAVNYVTLGSAIRISGSALIPSNTTTVDSVYLQIVKGSANLSDDEEIGDKYTLTSSWAAAHGCTVMTKAQIQTALGKTLTFTDDFAWGIKAEKTSAWSLTINENDEMSPASGQLTYIAIRACAVNAEGKVGSWTNWYYINIDDTAPTQSPMLYQFKTTAPSTNCVAANIIAASNISASSTYTSDMYLKGDWYLTIKLNDESSIDTKKTVVKHGSSTLTAGTGYYVSSLVTGSDGKEKTQYLFIPVSTAEETASYTVVVEDSEHRITDTYNLNIDNHAPEITAVYKGSTDNSANYLSEDSANTVTDSNYVYTMGGKVSETGSGFARLVFYYVRANAIDGETYTTEAVLDPLIITGTADAKAAISGLTRHSYTQDTSTYYMYGKEIAGTLGADGFTFTATTAADISGNAHIREGGLIEVAGLLRRIDTISSGTVTFATSTGVTSETSATAFFPYAQVVDNTTTEKVSSQSANPFSFTDDADDGDLMPETLTGSKALGFTWDATIHTYNISDGPCALVVLAFDAAGNVSGEVYPVKVENSAPRLAKVFLGTDLNSSGTWSANEFTGYNVYDANNTYGIENTEVKASQKISTGSYGSAFQIKDKLAVVAEIVGGNGDIMMVYGRGASSTAAVPSSGTGAGITATANTTITSLVSSEAIGTVTYNNADAATSLKGYTLTNAQIVAAVTEANDGTGKKASFTFWDSTDELVQGTTSQNCVLLVNDFTIDLVDSVPPRVVINPFYWESASKNSLYGNSSSNGHIELESDLTGTAAATLYGSDPKVSGKITFTGTAYDEHSLKNLKFTLANSSEIALTGFSSIAMGSYDSTSTDKTYVANGGWSALSGNSGAAVSSTGKYEWTISTVATDASRYYEDTAYLSQEGHKVYWTISIDTAQIPNVAEQNIKLTVTATDKAGTASTGAASSAPDTTDGAYVVTDGTTHVPSYQMDVVPYVTKIQTSVRKASGLKDNNIRSASGKYSILANNAENIITVKGFNFNTSDFVAKIANAATSAATTITKTNGGTALTASASAADTATITNSGISKSGYLEVFSKGVRALNNINSNDAHGSFTRTSSVDDYKNMPNRVDEADFYTTKNITLTDDRYLRFFDMKKTNTKNGYYPVMIMDGDDPVFGFVDANGCTDGTCTYIAQCFQPQRRKFNSDGTVYSTEYLVGGITWDQMAMTKDAAGRYYQVSVYNQNGGTMGLYYNQYASLYNNVQAGNAAPVYDATYYNNVAWQLGTGYSGYNGNWSYAGTNNALTLDAINYGGVLVDRYQNIKLIADGDSTSEAGASVYQSYYDDKTGEIIFRQLKIGTYKRNGTLGTRLYNGANSDNSITYNQGTNFTENTSQTGAAQGRNTVTSAGSKYYDFAVTSANIAVFAYYDFSEGRIRIMYSSATIDGTPGTSVTFTENTSVMLPDYVGQYMSMTIDNNNGIHIAAFDANDSDLKYIYLTSYNATSYTAMTVDAAGSVGNWTSIKIDTDFSHPYYNKPVIAYYNATETGGRDAIKLAYAKSEVGSVEEGIDSSTNYTSSGWEYMTVPSVDPAQGGSLKFQQVCLDFDSNGLPVVGYLGTNLEFGKWFEE